MAHPSREQYLESKVFTASQPKLHLMLLDGALRFGTQAKDSWTEENGFALARQPLERMFDIVEELLQGLASGEGEISAQLADQYAFIYRELAVCRINEDRQKLESCLDLLAFQRETWRLASEQTDVKAATPTPSNAAPSAKPAMPHMNRGANLGTTQTSAGMSFEA